ANPSAAAAEYEQRGQPKGKHESAATLSWGHVSHPYNAATPRTCAGEAAINTRHTASTTPDPCPPSCRGQKRTSHPNPPPPGGRGLVGRGACEVCRLADRGFSAGASPGPSGRWPAAPAPPRGRPAYASRTAAAPVQRALGTPLPWPGRP